MSETLASLLRPWLSTEQLAATPHLKPQSLRAAICRSGHYFGLQPRKMLNGRLLWPADSLERLQSPEVE